MPSAAGSRELSVHTFELYFAAAIIAGTPLLLAATGELACEKVGLLNLGIEGLMLVGGVVGVIVSLKTHNPEWGLLAAAAAGAAFNLLLYGLPVVLLGTEQVLPGFGLWFVGLGLSQLLGSAYQNTSVSGPATTVNLPVIDRIPIVKELIGRYPWPVYLAFVLPFVLAWMLRNTRHGRNMRAIGEDPQAAASGAGIAVRRWRMLYVGVNGLLGGFAGAFLAVIAIGQWGTDLTAGRGFVALAVVIFAAWRPLRLIVGAYVIGGLLILAELGGALGWPVSSALLGMMPYIGAVLILVIWALRARERGESAAPAALGMARSG
ncbi:MAG: ABC transporter permease [Streptosporangiaceae bacterium]